MTLGLEHWLIQTEYADLMMALLLRHRLVSKELFLICQVVYLNHLRIIARFYIS